MFFSITASKKVVISYIYYDLNYYFLADPVFILFLFQFFEASLFHLNPVFKHDSENSEQYDAAKQDSSFLKPFGKESP